MPSFDHSAMQPLLSCHLLLSWHMCTQVILPAETGEMHTASIISLQYAIYLSGKFILPPTRSLYINYGA